jgi:hypothetical protein
MIDDAGEIQPPKIIMILSLPFEALLLRRRKTMAARKPASIVVDAKSR